MFGCHVSLRCLRFSLSKVLDFLSNKCLGSFLATLKTSRHSRTDGIFI